MGVPLAGEAHVVQEGCRGLHKDVRPDDLQRAGLDLRRRMPKWSCALRAVKVNQLGLDPSETVRSGPVPASEGSSGGAVLHLPGTPALDEPSQEQHTAAQACALGRCCTRTTRNPVPTNAAAGPFATLCRRTQLTGPSTVRSGAAAVPAELEGVTRTSQARWGVHDLHRFTPDNAPTGRSRPLSNHLLVAGDSAVCGLPSCWKKSRHGADPIPDTPT